MGSGNETTLLICCRPATTVILTDHIQLRLHKLEEICFETVRCLTAIVLYVYMHSSCHAQKRLIKDENCWAIAQLLLKLNRMAIYEK